ncbi:MAG: chemotaxis response regulator protein-glutamate methylesterase [Terriglobales bacterium]|jgi:two-component system chemotaxis response regulator CheB
MNTSLENSKPIQVLVADDNAFMRTAITRMIESDPDLRVGATAQNGPEALELAASLQPDVVTLDVKMPGLSGLEILKRMMKENPRPVIMVSSETEEGTETSLEALEAGAFDCVAKQKTVGSLDIVKIREELIAKIKAAAESGRRRRRVPSAPPKTIGPASALAPSLSKEPGIVASVVAIGISTGGPKALQDVLPLLPSDLPVGVLIVQHMPLGFTEPFARRLGKTCRMSVHEASHQETVKPGVVYIAPAGQHMTVARRSPALAEIHISTSPEGMLHTPSVDVMMLSVAQTYGAHAMGVIMTGMGADGLRGMQAIAQQGGLTIGQDEATCAVYGMPRSCAESGVLQRVVPLLRIPEQIMLATRYRPRE